MTDAKPPPLFTRYGFTRTDDPKRPLSIAPYPAVCAEGALRAAVVASAIDLVGSFVAREAAGSEATFTTDLSLRITRPGTPAGLVAQVVPLRVGRRLVTTGVRLEAGDDLYAYGETTFLRIARDGEAAPATLETPASIPFHPLPAPLDEAVGVEVLDADAGRVRLVLRPELLNPEGVLQGALVALLCECSAVALAGRSQGRPAAVTELDLRYLRAASQGPVEGRAAWIGPPEAGSLRVELRDLGRSDRLTATALLRVDDAPGAS